MSDERTVTEDTDPDTGPISQVENRMVPRGTAMGSAIDACMGQARRVLAGFVLDAQAKPPRLKAEFDIFGAGKLGVSQVSDITLVDDRESADPAFVVSFEYRGREPLKHVSQSEVLYSKLRKQLFDSGLKFSSAAGATVYKIAVEAVVPASVRIAANRATGNVEIRLRNVTLLGTVEYEIPARQFTNEFIDSVASLIGSHANTFYALASAVSRPRRY